MNAKEGQENQLSLELPLLLLKSNRHGAPFRPHLAQSIKMCTTRAPNKESSISSGIKTPNVLAKGDWFDLGASLTDLDLLR